MDTNNTIDQDFENSVLTQYVGVASFTMLVWDHIITFSDEVEYLWKGGKGLAVYLFFLNRYLIPLSFIVNLWAYFSTSWTLRSCGHFVRYEGSMTMIGISIVFLMMFLRIRALYARFLSIQAFVFALFLIFVGINAYVLSHGIPVHHPSYPLVDSCTMIVDPKVGRVLASSTAWLPLLYDTVVISLTVYRTASSVYTRSTSNLFSVLFREGLLYYSVICTITLVLTIMINSTGQSIRNVASQLHLCLTVAMMSRITLHLRRFANSPDKLFYHDAAPQFPLPHQYSLTCVSQPVAFAPPPTVSVLSSIYAPPPKLQPLPHVPVTRSARAAAAAEPSLENGTYFAMESFSTATTPAST